MIDFTTHGKGWVNAALWRRRAMIACTNCRKRKIKCVTTEEPPRNPCARCTKRALSCEYVAVDEDSTPESPVSQLPSVPYPSPYNSGTAYSNPGVPTGYMPSPSYPPYNGQWNPPPSQSHPSFSTPVYPTQNGASYNRQQYGPGPGGNPFGGHGYSSNGQYGYPQSQPPTIPGNQWPQGSSIQPHSRNVFPTFTLY
ncbi:hypothetical protein C8R43DRAFT_381464 [Mycena crocata]|nr:hypothetical protein C8R43DRAFT_381464 [Mycena crocata]